MKPSRQLVFLLLACALIFGVNAPAAPDGTRTVRPAAWAGKFYPATRSELAGAVERLTRRARRTAVAVPPGKSLKALILPHAGYIYSGWTAAHASHLLTPGQFSKVVLVGPDHRLGFRGAAVSAASGWETPLGEVRLHDDAARLVAGGGLFRVVPDCDRLEHSLEVVLPFLQAYLETFRLVPVVAGRGAAGALAGEIDPLLDDGTLLVVSSDLSHYLPYEEAVARDRETIGMIRELSPERLGEGENRACGVRTIQAALLLARRHGWVPQLIHYANSGDTAGTKDRVVGYAAIAFWGDAMKEETDNGFQLSEESGRLLIRLARRTIAERLGQRAEVPAEDADRLADPRFEERLGTFVTLKIDDRLRGCIGCLGATETLREGVRRNAINAAFHDPRFAPLTVEELDRVEIEISVLTDPEPLYFRGGDDLIAKLRPHVDGVILRKKGASATFLPQVWEQLPRPEDFLSRLCMKAGLPSRAWRDPGVDVLTYQVRYFEEHR